MYKAVFSLPPPPRRPRDEARAHQADLGCKGMCSSECYVSVVGSSTCSKLLLFFEPVIWAGYMVTPNVKTPTTKTLQLVNTVY